MSQRLSSDILADDSKITGFQFEDVRAATKTGCLRATGVGIRTESSNKHVVPSNYGEICRQPFPHDSLTLVIDSKHLNAVCNALSGVLRAEREYRGLSMNALAERAGLSQQMVSYVERGMRIPTIETLLRLAMALEVDLPELLTRAEITVSRRKTK